MFLSDLMMSEEKIDQLLLHCALCDTRFEDSLEFDDHLSSRYHALQYNLYCYNTKRRRVIKNRRGVRVDVHIDPTCNIGCEFVEDRGYTTTKIAANEEVRFNIYVKNVGKQAVNVTLLDMLLFNPDFTIEDEGGVHERSSVVKLEVEQIYYVKVSFCCNTPSVYIVPLAFGFELLEKEETFSIVRDFNFEVQQSERLEEAIKLTNEVSPFQREEWLAVERTVPCSFLPGKVICPTRHYEVPEEMKRLIKNRLNPPPQMTTGELEAHMKITGLFYGHLTNWNYKDWFHTLLFIEEYDEVVKLESYNMKNVHFHHLEGLPLFELEVPGLAEKRPSILRNDFIYTRMRYGEEPTDVEGVEYEGTVHDVRDDTVRIGFSFEFIEQFYPNLTFDVRFTISRYPIVTMHRAIDNLINKEMFDLVFPEHCDDYDTFPPLLADADSIKFFDARVESNPEQRQAVINIVLGSSRPVPYLIFGPPGTGKTLTVVETILQVKVLFSNSFILICAPSNAACDLITQMLGPKVPTKDILRLHSGTRDWLSVPDNVKPYSNYKDDNYYIPSNLNMYRIVICTLTGSGKLVDKLPEHFTHVFIDECSQALEPEAIVPIAGLLSDAKKRDVGGHVILAGDPQQLGPVCNSYVGLKFKFQMSYLQRLMETCHLYQKDPEANRYNDKFLTKLLRNYRSHPDILYLPNEMFYGGELKYHSPEEVRNDPIIRYFPNKTIKPFPVIFHGVLGWDRREGRSPSYYNQEEIREILHYLKLLLDPQARVTLQPSEIGIVAPYIRQVYKLKQNLEARGWKDILVGSVEVFQGQEKRVIIITTVRSNPKLLDFDKKFRLGFLVDKRRFNVAVTRARSLLIVVGNPYNLFRDKRWRKLIEFAEEHKSYTGCQFKKKDDKFVEDLLRRLSYVGIEGPAPK